MRRTYRTSDDDGGGAIDASEAAAHSMDADEVEEDDDNAPLDLSLPAGRRRRNRTFSGTDSDDSGGPGGDEKAGGKAAYKKSLMKRYCEYTFMFKLLWKYDLIGYLKCDLRFLLCRTCRNVNDILDNDS